MGESACDVNRDVDSRGDGEDAETRRKGMEDQSVLGQPKS